MSAGGMLIGLAFGVTVRWLLSWMRQRDAGRDQQICLTLAVAYLSFYVANSPANVSGQPVTICPVCSLELFEIKAPTALTAPTSCHLLHLPLHDVKDNNSTQLNLVTFQCWLASVWKQPTSA